MASTFLRLPSSGQNVVYVLSGRFISAPAGLVRIFPNFLEHLKNAFEMHKNLRHPRDRFAKIFHSRNVYKHILDFLKKEQSRLKGVYSRLRPKNLEAPKRQATSNADEKCAFEFENEL